MNDEQKMDLGMRVHTVESYIDDLLKAAGTTDGRDELSMMLKPLTLAYWDLGKVLMKIGYATSKQAERV